MNIGVIPDNFSVDERRSTRTITVLNRVDINGAADFWYEVRRPWRLHLCWPQTIGLLHPSWHQEPMRKYVRIDRCGCGAIRYYERGKDGPSRWIDRNTRRQPTRSES